MSTETILASPELPMEEISTTTEDSLNNIGVALGLVILAGGATSIGAAVVYIPSLVNLANSKTLAISLGLSAGVMIFVSFIEIFGKSQESFEEAGFEPEQAYALAMATFFAGAIVMLISHYALEYLLGGHEHAHEQQVAFTSSPEQEEKEETNTSTADDIEAPSPSTSTSPPTSPAKKTSKKKDPIRRTNTVDTVRCSRLDDSGSDHDVDLPDPLATDSDWGTMMLPCCDHQEDVREKIKTLQEMAEEMKEYEEKKEDRKMCMEAGIPEDVLDGHKNFEGLKEAEKQRAVNDRMMHMSYKTAFAIALHNFPEGLATFVAALGDPKMGLVLAIGIAIHNIPEGLAVALPMYYATGNRRKAFICGTLSGCTEIFAALLGWAVLANAFSATLYAVVFGIVSGMMVLISVRELLPTAHRHDPEDKYVTVAFTSGMIIMALSLALMALF